MRPLAGEDGFNRALDGRLRKTSKRCGSVTISKYSLFFFCESIPTLSINCFDNFAAAGSFPPAMERRIGSSGKGDAFDCTSSISLMGRGCRRGSLVSGVFPVDKAALRKASFSSGVILPAFTRLILSCTDSCWSNMLTFISLLFGSSPMRTGARAPSAFNSEESDIS